MHRIALGQVAPTLSTLRELALAQGLDIDLSVRPVSDPHAAAAARAMLEGDLDESTLDEATLRWVHRLERYVGLDADPVDLLLEAGRMADLTSREGAVFLRGDRSPRRLGSAGAASGQRWALSGGAALHALGHDSTAPSILWVDDPRSIAPLLGDTHDEVMAGANAQVILASPSTAELDGAEVLDGVQCVAPIQLLLDLASLGPTARDMARDLAARWWSE